jgi:HlyD family secretion protein
MAGKISKKRLLIILPIIASTAVLTLWYTQVSSRTDQKSILVSGNIEVTDAEVSFKIAGRVEERLVSEGERVKAGQIVALLDRTDLAQEVALRKAEIQAAQATLAELEAGSRLEEIQEAESSYRRAKARLAELLSGSRPQEVESAKAAVKSAEAEVVRWKAEYERYRQLYERDAISLSKLEAVQTKYRTSFERLREAEEKLKLVIEGPRKEQIEQARASLTETKARLELVRKGPRQEEIDRARAELQKARAALALAETRLSYATLTSPLTGIVLSENVEPGEYVAPGTPVVTVGKLENVWLRAYINETDLGRVKVGQLVQVTTDTYPDKICEGQISFISSEAEFTPKSVQTTEERVKLVYRIKIDIPNPNMELKPGMPADADILIDRER